LPSISVISGVMIELPLLPRPLFLPLLLLLPQRQ